MSESASKIRDKRTKPRFKIQVHARIKAQLIGSSSKFPFVTENISESGVLLTHPDKYNNNEGLASPKNAKVNTSGADVNRKNDASSQSSAKAKHAFNQHSILEVWLYNDRNEEIFFFAKYVRKADENSFAIRIIDIDSTNAKKYQEFLEAHRASSIPDKEDESEQEN
jgi:hypothetical protein